MKQDGFKIVSEIVKGNPNVDMLIQKSYLYVYIDNDDIDSVKKNGLATHKSGAVQAFFTRLPESQYPEYLETHTPAKISVAKLAKVKDQKVIVRPINFKFDKENLDEDDIQKILEKGSKKIKSMLKNKEDISRLPRADIIASKKIIPAFAIKILDLDVKQESSLKRRIAVKVAKMASSKQGRSLARSSRRNPGSTAALQKMAGAKPGAMTRRQGTKMHNKFKSTFA